MNVRFSVWTSDDIGILPKALNSLETKVTDNIAAKDALTTKQSLTAWATATFAVGFFAFVDQLLHVSAFVVKAVPVGLKYVGKVVGLNKYINPAQPGLDASDWANHLAKAHKAASVGFSAFGCLIGFTSSNGVILNAKDIGVIGVKNKIGQAAAAAN
jgi:hypothetical protein